MAVAALINRIRFVLIFELLQSSIGAFIFGEEAWSFILIAIGDVYFNGLKLPSILCVLVRERTIWYFST